MLKSCLLFGGLGIVCRRVLVVFGFILVVGVRLFNCLYSRGFMFFAVEFVCVLCNALNFRVVGCLMLLLTCIGSGRGSLGFRVCLWIWILFLILLGY